MTDSPTVYLLERDGVLLGRMPLRSAETFAIHCDFQPTEAFTPYRALFDEDARLAAEVATDPDPDLLARAEAVLDRIMALGFTVRREGGGIYRDVLIGIEGGAASFRPMSPEEEPL
ncbi:hypothetical protein E5F05_03320 (plasmid) [Deinococcus metallilatus]|uniref:Uncharacterized protein n=1 Tax=Deinococcus metallilatus TaxID=1211322 RepID=A0AAJ5FBN0_9DEIO|nr:hypothetical protein [Deinococcus metallilatus]MBB5297293.1 hypothetical protein [Deinococcus metallilatus]QBY06961.1 hypothetical protein E5F05_03320 [Deinococcus metallilatus]TLK31908.1 hypothetical protein FCS05_00085 [Deinococcus metallilatus]GMA17143.1 hypothetical protein GCM10025871_34740 [Deinococcus metallilatus]